MLTLMIFTTPKLPKINEMPRDKIPNEIPSHVYLPTFHWKNIHVAENVFHNSPQKQE